MWSIVPPAPEPAEPKPFEQSSFAEASPQRYGVPPDLHTQWEDLINQVFDSERRERILDRCDQAARLDELKRRKAKRETPRRPV